MRLLFSILLFGGLSVFSAKAEDSTIPDDPFGEVGGLVAPADYPEPVDRERGRFILDAADGTYVPGDHFANWHWTANPTRWGNYYVGLRYRSNRTKLGVQIKVGDLAPVKSYAPRTGRDREATMILGTVYIPEPKEYRVMLLTGDQSNVPDFSVTGIEFIPAPEGDQLGQSIDGTIDLSAATATTYSEKMRYEPQEKKNCLGFWLDEKDWAEWNFDVTTPGKFAVSVIQGCGGGNGGSEVAIFVNDQALSFAVEDTGGFQNWKELPLGEVVLAEPGTHKVAVVPRNKAGKAVMDIQRILLTPIDG